MEIYKEFKELVEIFERDVLMAKRIESPNPNDDLNIKTAIVGFSYSSQTENWGGDHFNFVKERLEQDYSEDELKQYNSTSGISANNAWRITAKPN